MSLETEPPTIPSFQTHSIPPPGLDLEKTYTRVNSDAQKRGIRIKALMTDSVGPTVLDPAARFSATIFAECPRVPQNQQNEIQFHVKQVDKEGTFQQTGASCQFRRGFICCIANRPCLLSQRR